MEAERILRLQRELDRQKTENAQHRIRTDLRIDALVAALQQNTNSAGEVIALYANLKGAFQIFGWVSKAATWIGKVSVAVGIVWAIWKYLVIEAIQDKFKG